MKQYLITALKGAAIGGTMLIPGVSGGTMAIMLGLYDRLIRAVSEFFRHMRESFLFLFWFCLGGGAGIFLLAQPLLRLMEAFPFPAGYFFMGAIAGSVPLTYQKSSVRSFSWRVPVYVLLGAGIAWLLSGTPAFRLEAAEGAGMLLLLVFAGFIAAVALVLPGISVSYLLLVLGLYDRTIRAITALDLAFLLPMGVGLVIGVFATTKLLERLMERHPQPTYLVILGFMLASLPAVFPGLPIGWGWLICPAAFLAGFAVIYQVSHLE